MSSTMAKLNTTTTAACEKRRKHYVILWKRLLSLQTRSGTDGLLNIFVQLKSDGGDKVGDTMYRKFWWDKNSKETRGLKNVAT